MLHHDELMRRLTYASAVVMAYALPVAAWAQSTPLENPLGAATTPWELFSRVAGALNLFTAILALVFIVLGGYWILSAAGNSERYAHGKRMVTFALLGMIVVTATYTILMTTINILTGGATPSFRSTTGLFDPLQVTNLATFGPQFYGGRVLRYLLQGLGALTVLMFVWAGFLWMTAAGNQERIGKAKRTLSYAIIGVIIVLSSYVIISFAYAPFVQALK